MIMKNDDLSGFVMKKADFEKLNDFLAFLSICGENFEIALAALKLQTAITETEKNKK